jgi:hypothetical protein
MLKLIITSILILVFSIFCFGQKVQNNGIEMNLIQLLDNLKTIDQKWRNLSTKITNGEIDSISIEFVNRMINKIDSLNFTLLTKIVEEYCFPNFDLVGKDGSHNFWLLVQHKDKHVVFQEFVLELMKIEITANKASKSEYAYLMDRVKVNSGQLQIYGTQMYLNKDKTSYEPKPVIYPRN